MYDSKDGVIKQKLILWKREWDSRSNNLDGALLDSKPTDTSTPEPPPPVEPDPVVEPEPEPEPEPDPEPDPEPEPEEPETVITVTPTTPLSFDVVEDGDSDARLINIKATGLGIFALTVNMPAQTADVYFDVQFPGFDKNYGNSSFHFSSSDFPDLPDGEVDFDIEVYVEEAMDDGAVGNITVSAGDAATVRIPVTVTFIPG